MTRRRAAFITLAAAGAICAGVYLAYPTTVDCMLHPGQIGGECGPLPSDEPPEADPTGIQPRVDSIEALANQIEIGEYNGQYDSVRREIPGRGDSAYATVFTRGGEVAKVRARLYSGSKLSTYTAYYDHETLVYLLKTDSRLPGEITLDEQRHYFAGGRMIRWLSGTGRWNEPADTRAYADIGRSRIALGAQLVRSAHGPGPEMPFSPF